MYSNSSSFLGAGNSSRPNGPPYGQSSFSTPINQQPQPPSFAPQPTGYGGMPLQAQYTGYPGPSQAQSLQPQPQLPQFTGYNGPGSQNAQIPLSQQQQPSNISLQSTQAPLQAPVRSNQTSSQIAQSFQSGSKAQVSKPPSKGVKIPSIRLSFLTAQDQAKFEQLFKSAVGDGQALDGDKVRDLLIRSKLPGSDLMQIWILSDTTKSGQLLFPEFALAMYLCNLRIVGKDLPSVLPEKIKNEVSSMVDIISFGVPDHAAPAPRSNAPDFNIRTGSPGIQQPQPQASNAQLLAQLAAQPTGFASQYVPPQPTGFQQNSTLQSQSTGFQPQQAPGFQQTLQGPGYTGPRPPMPPMPTGIVSSYSQGQNQSTPQQLNAQPTGLPGQWGLVNAPATGLPNIDALQQRMMPQPGREGGFTTAGLSGTATVPWAVTKEEKKIYDQLFKAWDGFNKGFIGGDTAIEVMSQSGLEKSDLEKIWTLSDPGNKGRLDMDEFAVAMHLIYRKLNGYPVPNRLPPELVPPSTRNFADSIGTVKSLLSQDAETRKNTGAFLQPQRTGVSYLKTHSFRDHSVGSASGRKDATVFRNNDDDVGYKSSARRRLGGGGRTPSPVQPGSPASDSSVTELSLEQLRKKVREKQILLDAIDFKDENNADEEDALDRRDKREAEDLYRRIRRVQDDIDSHPAASFRSVDSDAERRTLKRQLQALTDKLPQVVSNVRKTERSIADAKLELFRLRDVKAHPGGASAIFGTGPGGSMSEADRLKARAKAMMQQRSAALSGRPTDGSVDEISAATGRLEEENYKIRAEKENNERIIKDIEDSVQVYSRGIEDSLKESVGSSASEHERRRWEDALGVEEEVKDFIFDLQRASRSAKIRRDDTSREKDNGVSKAVSRQEITNDSKETKKEQSAVVTTTPAQSGATSSSYMTAVDRAAFIKQQAEQRMAERLAALGLKPPVKPGESIHQKQEREAKEREERLRKAEAEDVKLDQERKRRLAEEQSGPPPAVKPTSKKPPPPPSRKSRTDSVGQRGEVKKEVGIEAQKQRAELESREKIIKEQQEAQQMKTKELENEARRREEELANEREATEARLRALEEQYKAGKLKKQEEKRKRQATEKEEKEKEARLAIQRAELDAAREKERQLRLQLESLGDEEASSDDEEREATVEEPTSLDAGRANSSSASKSPKDGLSSNTGNETSRPISAVSSSGPMTTPPTAAVLATSSPSYSTETKNPFFKQLSQSSDINSQATPTIASITSPANSEVSTNPFHRLTQQEGASKAGEQPASTPTGNRPSRVRLEEDEWSAVDSNDDSSDEDDEKPTGGSAKQLASILFGTMGPPRPLSALDDKKSPTSPPPDEHKVAPNSLGMTSDSTMGTSFGATPPPPAPPLPGLSEAPSAAPPPPPPPPLPVPATTSAISEPSGAPPPPPTAGFNSTSSAPPAPPPPAPAPPPPTPGPAPNSGAPRPAIGALLGEITKGKGLRKVETVDKSAASVAGRVLN